MKLITYGTARDNIKLELEMVNENFVSENEFIGFFNKAIDEAEAEIHSLCEDYFLTSAALNMVLGASQISLPGNIYAQKIREIIYANGTEIYPVTLIRGDKKFLDITETNTNNTAACYRYFVRNDSTTAGYKIQLVPPARETSTNLTLWYLRNANRIPLVGEAKDPGPGNYVLAECEAIILDIPEFINFVLEIVKGFCMAKVNAGVIPQGQVMIIESQRTIMISTLTRMVADDDTKIPADLSHYEEHE